MAKEVEIVRLSGILRFEIFYDKAKKYRWRAKSKNGKCVASSGESFASKQSAIRALDTFLASLNF